jgi:hypothetical protein
VIFVVALLVFTHCTGGTDELVGGGPSGGLTDAGTLLEPDELGISPAQLSLVPGERRQLLVQAIPPGRYHIYRALLGEATGAYLDRGDLVTRDDGRGNVWLSAPVMESSFTLRAFSGTKSADARITVSGVGRADISVRPSYAGYRVIDEWVASVHEDTRCSDLDPSAIPDGSQVARGLSNEWPLLRGAPVGPPLAVTVRAEQYASGCRDVGSLQVGGENAIEVVVSDRPLRLPADGFEATLTLSDNTALRAKLTGTANLLTSAFRGDSVVSVDASLLLDAMAQAFDSDVEAAAFASRRASRDWDALLGATYPSTLGAGSLSSLLSGWMTQSLDGLFLVATFVGIFEPREDSSEEPLFTLNEVVENPADTMGFSREQSATITIDPEDQVRLGTTLSFSPEALMRGLATNFVTSEQLGTSMPNALIGRVDCGAIATTLDESDEQTGDPISGSCDLDCAEILCREALRSMWERTLSVDTNATIEVIAAGKAAIDSEAVLTTADGTFIGIATLDADSPVAVDGQFQAGTD